MQQSINNGSGLWVQARLAIKDGSPFQSRWIFVKNVYKTNQRDK